MRGIRPRSMLNVSGTINKTPSNTTCLDLLGDIAGLLGGFCCVDRAGIVRINSFPSTVTREVLEWSKQRHWTFAWWIIICVAIMGCYYFYQAGSEQDYVAKRQALTDEQVQTELSEAITRQQSYIDTYNQKLAIDTISEETRSLYEKYLENATEEIKELKAYNVETYKKHLVDRADAGVWRERWEAIWCFIWIVLYIFACRPRGYMITKRRREDKMATGLKKILFGIAGALVGAAGALYVTTTITKWSDGSKTRDEI